MARGTERPGLYLQAGLSTSSLSLGKQDPQEEVVSNSAFSPLGENLPQARKSHRENAPVIPHCAYDPGAPPTAGKYSHLTDEPPGWPRGAQVLMLRTNETVADPKVSPQPHAVAPTPPAPHNLALSGEDPGPWPSVLSPSQKRHPGVQQFGGLYMSHQACEQGYVP